MAVRMAAAVLVALLGVLSLGAAWNHYAYQSEFSRAVAAMKLAIALSGDSEKWEEAEKHNKRAKAIFERLLASRFFANPVTLHYNPALLAYARVEFASAVEEYDTGMAHLREALTRTNDPAVRSEILFALSFGAGSKHLIYSQQAEQSYNSRWQVVARSLSQEALAEQLRFLSQALIEEPDHSSPRAKRAKRWWELLMRELKRRQGKGGNEGKPQPERQSIPGYGPEEPKP